MAIEDNIYRVVESGPLTDMAHSLIMHVSYTTPFYDCSLADFWLNTPSQELKILNPSRLNGLRRMVMPTHAHQAGPEEGRKSEANVHCE